MLEGSDADLEEAWLAFTQMEATDWHFLPYAGGLLEQPELLMRNLYKIKVVANNAREAHQDGR